MITSAANSRVKRLVQLREKKKVRDSEGVFIIEGSKLFLEAPLAMIREVYLSEDFAEEVEKYCRKDWEKIPSATAEKSRWGEIAEKLAVVSSERVSAEVFRKLSDTATPQGILCVVEQFHTELNALISDSARSALNLKNLSNSDESKSIMGNFSLNPAFVKNPLIKNPPFLLLLEDIQDPGNLGTILRTAEGAGVDGVIMSDGCVDIYNPKTIRATMGSVFRMPFVYTDDLGAAVHRLQNSGIKVYAAGLARAQDYTAGQYVSGTAFLIGNEGNGLRKETAKKADVSIKIPMAGQVESLNAATAAAILLYEAQRQRRI